MPKDRTPESGVPLYKRAQRLVGKGRGTDIPLPMGARDQRDPRLPPDPAETGRAIREGLESVRGLMKKTSARAASRTARTRRA